MEANKGKTMTKYGIQQRRSWYAGTISAIHGWHWVGLYDCPDEYPSIAAARSRIREMDGSIYETAHGEAGRPEYRVRALK